jgi:DNA-binding phage protein
MCYVAPVANQTGFDKWAAKKLEDPSFAKEYRSARERIDAVDALVRALDEVREGSGISKADLARRIDAKPESVRRLFTKPGANPTLQTVVEIAAALGLRLELVPATQKKQAAKIRPRRVKAPESRAVA